MLRNCDAGLFDGRVCWRAHPTAAPLLFSSAGQGAIYPYISGQPHVCTWPTKITNMVLNVDTFRGTFGLLHCCMEVTPQGPLLSPDARPDPRARKRHRRAHKRAPNPAAGGALLRKPRGTDAQARAQGPCPSDSKPAQLRLLVCGRAVCMCTPPYCRAAVAWTAALLHSGPTRCVENSHPGAFLKQPWLE